MWLFCHYRLYRAVLVVGIRFQLTTAKTGRSLENEMWQKASPATLSEFHNFKILNVFPFDNETQHGADLVETMNAAGPWIHVQDAAFFVPHDL